MMRIFKRRSSDPSPQLVSLSPLVHDEHEEVEDVRQTKSGQSTPTGKGSCTPNNRSPKAYRKGKLLIDFFSLENYLLYTCTVVRSHVYLW